MKFLIVKSSGSTTGCDAKTIILVIGVTSFQNCDGKSRRYRIWEKLHKVKGKNGICELKVFSENCNRFQSYSGAEE